MKRASLRQTNLLQGIFVGLAMTIWLAPALAAKTGPAPTATQKASEESCALLDDPTIRGKMDGLLRKLLVACGREHELGLVFQSPAVQLDLTEAGSDVPVSDPSGDTSASSHTQSETAVALDPVTGTLCSGYNDSYHHFADSEGFTGFSRSTDGGATFTDQGALGANSSGDPSIVWRKADGFFYFAALESSGLGIWKSQDDCQTFSWVGNIHVGSSDDKELIAVDNNTSGSYYGRMYNVWTDFGAGGLIFSTYSDDAGATWSTPVRISDATGDFQGAWPAVAPNGDIFVGWVRWNPYPDGPIDVEIVRSTDGGDTWAATAEPLTGAVNPRDSSATGNCGRPALNGNIRYLPSPQLTVGPDGALHVVYSYDQDGFNTGDTIDVFYRRSDDSGASWGTEIQLNDDGTNTDQYFPSVSVGETNIVVTAWYDRRLDAANNLLIDYYQSTSFDGGTTFEPSERLSDVSTPVFLDSNLATCYHGDYDQQVQSASSAHIVWADDRNIQDGHNDPDVFSDNVALSTDFLVTSTPSRLAICAPDDAVYTANVLQFQGFTEQVTLSVANLAAGLSPSFGTNPVTPPGTSTLTIAGTSGVAAGSYSFDIVGTSSPSTIVHDTGPSLDIFDAAPIASVLTAPADNAELVPLDQLFDWQDSAQAQTYEIEIARDVGFTDIADSAIGLASSEFTSSNLDSSTVYYWRARAINLCGDGAWSTTFTFATLPLPGDCPLTATVSEVYEEDFETGATGWTTGGDGSTWALSSLPVHGGASAFHADDVDHISDQYLISPSIALPSGQVPLTFQFWNRQELEDTGTGCFDGGVLEISTDGTNWTRLEAELLTDPYDGPVSTGFDNPIGGENAWCGDPQDWLNSIVDVAAWAGESVQFRFRLATDSSVGHPGWDIDDLRIRGCLTSDLFADGFESGNTTAWSATSP